MAIDRWSDGDLMSTIRLNVQVDGLNECMDALKRLEQKQKAVTAQPTGAAAVLAGGLVAAGSTAVVSRRSLLGFGWLRKSGTSRRRG